MLKQILTFFILVLLFNSNSFSEDLKIQLNFPKPAHSKAEPLKPKAKQITVSGDLSVDILPYPASNCVCLVEYFLNEQKIFETNGYAAGSQEMSFKYSIDTTKFPNGKYKLTINYWDKKGASAIGIRDIIINN